MNSADKLPDNDPRKDRKFFFDLNRFDEPEEEEENAPPPPPTFSQEELNKARQEGFDEGRTQALKEAAESREQMIALTLQQISTQFATIFAGEAERETTYEHEALALSIQALQKIFPVMNDVLGAHEVEKTIRTVLKSASDQSEITIHVPPDYVSDIEKIVAPLRDKDINPPSFHVRGDDTLKEGDCWLAWKDGGAVRDAHAISDTVLKEITALLEAARPMSDVPAAQKDDIKEQADTNQEEILSEPESDHD